MKYCSKCGRQSPDSGIFCSYCGNTLSNFEGSSYNPFGSPIDNPFSDDCYEAPLEMSHRILSVAMPIYGLAYWFYKRYESPRRARTAMMLAITSMGIYFAFVFLLVIVALFL